VRLPVHSHDELGAIATSFNRMAGELAASKHEVEDYSRNLEAMVAVRTRELRDSEASLLALKNHLATVLATVATGVIAVDEVGRVETFNERARAILGLGPEPVEGRPLEAVLGGERRPLLQALQPVLARESERHEGRVECRLAQGRRTLSVVASALVGESGQHVGVVVACEDLTRILATQRLEAWKEAVERVIHEIKNPLTPVALAAETLRTAWGEDRERFGRVFPSAIEMILGAVRDLRQLIEEFSRFSRLPRPRPTRLDLNAAVREATAAYAEAAPAAVELRLELAAGLPEVAADADQLRRVLLNVVNNALEAMAERPGRIVVRTERSGPDAVAIAVLDEGPGIEDVERVFEPHFSTKAKGTGLGLTIARQIVEEHGGTIQVHRRDPVGAAVIVELPTARET
jgi:two-component system nitrogen regulation sensor histidine kinase NtrY